METLKIKERKIIKRTFEALKYPEGSKEREELNLSAKTSAYMPSYKYIAVVVTEKNPKYNEMKFTAARRTKKEAQLYLDNFTRKQLI